MDSPQKQLTDKLTDASNILVTVSRNPSVDQLAACIALTLILNKLDKHATAVFSGEVPSTIEFLQPEGTLEKNTDSLRDFIIALDKSKADKLRYKVEDQLVRIFITPYRTSISQDDLDFSQGDFNVDLVIALGVAEQSDLDDAITAHGRILHDATVSSINASANGALGSINWDEPGASSLCELVGELTRLIGKDLLDAQIATALLTGIVAETTRFSNEKTSPETMKISSELLAAGADQQLVATKLQSQMTTDPSQELGKESNNDKTTSSSKSDDGTLEIKHDEDTEGEPEAEAVPEPEEKEQETENEPDENVEQDQLHITPLHQEPQLPSEPEFNEEDKLAAEAQLASEQPYLGNPITANSTPEPLEPSIDPLGPQPEQPQAALEEVEPADTFQPANQTLPTVELPKPAGFTPPPPEWVPHSDDVIELITPDHPREDPEPEPEPAPKLELPDIPGLDENALKTDTLLNIEEAVHSPHLQMPDINDAREEVHKALESSPDPLEPIQALNAQPLGNELHSGPIQPVNPPPSFQHTLEQTIPAVPSSAASPSFPSPDTALPQAQPPQFGDTQNMPPPIAPPILGPVAPLPAANDSSVPAVPPPIPYQFGNPVDQA
jgi:nanoRNase/pAp phosphatase (c-di-AMP/oligoRNAs hydrolase)